MRLISSRNFEYFRPQQIVFLSCLSLLKQQEARDENQSDLVKSFKDSMLIFNWRSFKPWASFVRQRPPFALRRSLNIKVRLFSINLSFSKDWRLVSWVWSFLELNFRKLKITVLWLKTEQKENY